MITTILTTLLVGLTYVVKTLRDVKIITDEVKELITDLKKVI